MSSYQEGTGKLGCFPMWKHPRGHVWNVVVETNPLIGRRYIPKTSDYATDKATGVSVDNLHGKEYIIVGEPFVKDGHLMVTIFSTDSEREYNVLFQENCIVKED